ncbi:MAG TPA: CHRD domain-containing protein [Steroidobacteraceae bacterium]|nr:CHRD domain-containing protein [Steroidobacteraceae bacterium]
MNRVLKTGLAALALATVAGSLMAHDDDDRGRDGRFVVRTNLEGFQEVPAVSTVASGRFRAVIDTKANTITWKLNYEGLEGAVQQAHVHFGQLSVNGGVSFFLCTNLGNGPAGTLTCPEGPAELTGVITPELVVGPAGTGIEAGAMAEIIAAIKNGTAYANVHSSKWTLGEIRGQLR